MSALIDPKEIGVIEFIPMGMSDKIKLSVKMVQTLLCKPTRSGATCTQQDALKFMALCHARRFNPFEGDAYIVGYDGRNGPEFSLITSIQAFLKRAEANENYDGMESGVIVKDAAGNVIDRVGDFMLDDDDLLGGWARVYKKNISHPTERRLRLSSRKKDTPFWNNDPAGQIVKCAEADALRATFPTVIGGLYVEGDSSPAIDITTQQAAEMQMAVVSPPPPIAQQLTQPPPDFRPEITAKKAAQEAQVVTANIELADMLDKEGFTFDHLVRWGADTGNIENADSIASISDLPEALCKRLLRAKGGLLKGLATVKGEAA